MARHDAGCRAKRPFLRLAPLARVINLVCLLRLELLERRVVNLGQLFRHLTQRKYVARAIPDPRYPGTYLKRSQVRTPRSLGFG